MCLCAKGGILLFDPYTKSVSYRFNNNITSNYVNLISDSCFFFHKYYDETENTHLQKESILNNVK